MAFSFQGSNGRTLPPHSVDVAPRKPSGRTSTFSCQSLSVLLMMPGLTVTPGLFLLRRKEVIHPLVLEGIPCFDLTPITGPALDAALPCGLGRRFRALPALMV